jgi:hypothetical protein
MPTNLKIVPRLLSFAAAAFVLLAVVNADAQSPATRSVVIPPIPPGQARIWIYSEGASSGFSGSSITMMSAPRPVSTPPVEVASR